MIEQTIAILDFGSQYTHLIARRTREMGVRSMIYPSDVSADTLQSAAGIILSGGPNSIRTNPLAFDAGFFDLNIPVLGLCYGHQLIADHFGGTVERGGAAEYGIATLRTVSCPIYDEVSTETAVWMSHGDHVATLPGGFAEIGETDGRSITAMADPVRRIYGFQYHPEVHHSVEGHLMLENFLFRICRAKKNWSVSDQLRGIKEDVSRVVGDRNVFLLVSGGVDSTVCYVLLSEILGKDRVYGFHVDHGFMRTDESEYIRTAMRDIGLDDLEVYDGREDFMTALEGVTDPETKREIIGQLFLDITEREMNRLGMDESWILGQGTIYPDTIESGGTKNAVKIKTHHNRVAKVQEMISAGRIVEPIRDLYKDEVRALGRLLGIPTALLERHPFPGPGLAIRCLASEKGQAAFESHPRENLTVLPLRSVGVQGDERTYAHPAVWHLEEIDWDLIAREAPHITNTYTEVNRVLITLLGDEKKVRHGRVFSSSLSSDRIGKLRVLDQIVNQVVEKHDLIGNIWQMPVVLIPFGWRRGESLVIRPLSSTDAMTITFTPFPEALLEELCQEIARTDLVDAVFFDVTNKPPGTIEWE